MKAARMAKDLKERVIEEVYKYSHINNFKINDLLSIMEQGGTYYVFTLTKTPLHKLPNVIVFRLRLAYSDKLSISHFIFVNPNNLPA